MEYENTILCHQHMLMDYKREYHRTYNQNSHILQQTATAWALKMKKELEKTYNDKRKRLVYKSYMAGPVPRDDELLTENKSA